MKRKVPCMDLGFSAHNDIVFKNLFANNVDILQSFLSVVLGIPESDITEITIKNGEITPAEISGKVCRLDLNLKVNNTLVNIEMQVAPVKGFKDRALCYWSEVFLTGAKQGEDYDNIYQTITVNILNFSLFSDDRYLREFVPSDTLSGEILSDKMHIFFMEMSKIPKATEGLEKELLKQWLQLLKSETKEELNMFSSSTPVLQKAARVIFDMSEETQIQEQVRARDWAVRNFNSAINEARANEELKTKVDIVNRMVNDGISLDKALQLAQLSMDAYRSVL